MNSKDTNLQCCVTQCERPLDQKYWNAQWESNRTGWDIGHAAPAITNYMEQYPDKNAAVLIPGCGNAHEADYLLQHGFTNITLLDIAPKAVELLAEKYIATPGIRVVCEDFFEHRGTYDLVIEQTFFCAIPPSWRNKYAKKMTALLRENGKLIGVLFDRTFEQDGPPFGGCTCEYKPVFDPYFEIKTMDPCYNSIPGRTDSEVFINLIKK